MCRLSWNLGTSTSWNPQDLSRPVHGLLNLYFILFWKQNPFNAFLVTSTWGVITFRLRDGSLLIRLYTGCPRRNGQNFGRVFLMLNYTDITQNNYIQSWTVTEIMAIEKCGLLGCPRTVSRPWRHTHPLRMPGNETPLANIVMQWPWRNNGPAAACVKYLET